MALKMISKAQMDFVANLSTPFDSRQGEDFVEILNRVAESIGAVPNMGIYADITSISGTTLIRAEMTDRYIRVKTTEEEQPGKNIEKKNDAEIEEEMELDEMAGPNGTGHEGVLGATIETHPCDTMEVCPDCNHHDGKCHICNGKGTLPCRECEGKGRCPDCNGTGSTDNGKCTACNGSGQCENCNGTGRIKCEACKGTGRCTTCNGTGEVTCRRCEGSGWYQTFTSYSAKVDTETVNYFNNKTFAPYLRKAQGTLVYNGRYRKWHKPNNLEYDRTDQMRRDSVKGLDDIAPTFDTMMQEHDRAIKKRGYPYIFSADVYTIPAVRIDFDLDDKQHSIIVIGHSPSVVLHDSLPSRLQVYRTGIFTRLKMSFNKSKRRMAYVKLAAYIAQCDDTDVRESRLLEAFLHALGMSRSRTEKVRQQLKAYDSNTPYELLRKEIEPLLDTKRTLTFAWQCMSHDGNLSEKELLLWDKLVAEYRLEEGELETLKSNAQRLAALGDSQIVEEYMRG